METMDYDLWVKKMTKANNVILKEFKEYLLSNQLSQKTVEKHLDNIDTFVNYYLLSYSYCSTMFSGYDHFDDFIGYWFIHKCMWSSVASIKSLVASLKKFYLFLAVSNYIGEEDLVKARLYLKQGLSEWIEECEDYDNGCLDCFD